MRVLAIHSGHNATAALLSGGVILGCVSEEKFTNVKNDASFPRRAIAWIRDEFRAEHFDVVAVCGSSSDIYEGPGHAVIAGLGGSQSRFLQSVKDTLSYHSHRLGYAGLLRAIAKARYAWALQKRRTAYERFLRDVLGLHYDECLYVDHHDCHAYSAYYGLRSNSGPALVFTLDGMGDFSCGRVYRVKDSRLERLSDTYWTHSIGLLYSNVTKLLGMKVLEHEYKVMGLAPYAEEKEYYRKTQQKLFDGLITLDSDRLEFRARIPMFVIDRYLKTRMSGERFDNIAAALQRTTEDLILAWIQAGVRKTGIRQVFTGGGVFMNVKVNKKIQELAEVDSAQFMPSCGDESLAIGAAYYAHIHRTGKDPDRFEHIYWGPSFSESSIEQFLHDAQASKRYVIEKVANIENRIAELLAQGHVVARFQGAAEWGARSLGNRAILARPDKLESFYEVNDRVKMRDFWMPFAPTILDKYAERYILNPKKLDAPYMISAFDSTPLGRSHLRAAMHPRDKTLRVQILRREVNPRYYNLIEAFYGLTGIGGVLNTSFNLHGYPLVGTPSQAMFTIDNCHLEYLAMENILLRKRDSTS